MKVLVVDDHRLFRDGIVKLLNAAEFTVVGDVGDGETAILETMRLNPDMVLLDLSMPGMDGFEVLKQIKDKRPNTAVVILTASDEDEVLLKAVRLGANGYLQKSLSSHDFLKGLRGLEEGMAAITLETATKIMASISTSDLDRQKSKVLTNKELEMVPLICEGLTNNDISKKLNISRNTVKFHIKNILQKLRISSRAEIATYAVQEGLYKKR